MAVRFGRIFQLSFHPRGDLLAAGAIDGSTWLWNVADPAQPVRTAVLSATDAVTRAVVEHQARATVDWLDTRFVEYTISGMFISPGVRLLDFGARVSPEGHFTWTAGGVQVRSDGLHLTPSGVQRWIAPWLLPRLRDAVSR